MACLPIPATRHPVTTCRVAAESVPSSGKRAALGWGAAAAAAAATYGFAAQPLTAHAEAPWKAEKGKGGDIAVSGSSREPAVGKAAGRAAAPLPAASAHAVPPALAGTGACLARCC